MCEVPLSIGGRYGSDILRIQWGHRVDDVHVKDTCSELLGDACLLDGCAEDDGAGKDHQDIIESTVAMVIHAFRLSPHKMNDSMIVF